MQQQVQAQFTVTLSLQSPNKRAQNDYQNTAQGTWL